MKKVYFLLLTALSFMQTLAQIPQKMSYQSVIRNSSNALLINQPVGMRISILQGSVNGTTVFIETHAPTTNAQGLISLEIGGGVIQSGSVQTINWANGPFFLRTETDPAGGTNYTISGTTQLLSVPYALFSGNGLSGVSAAGDTLFLGNGNHLIVPGISSANAPPAFDGSHTCGAPNMHNSNLTYGSMSDQDGNSYKTIFIGAQEWMAENLKTSHYRDGTAIPMVSDNTLWQNDGLGASEWPAGDSASNACPYGKLYNWFAAINPSGLCPVGWHIPTDIEWSTMISQIDPALTIFTYGPQSTFAGGKLKSASGSYWLSPNTGADNAIGFSAPGAGFRDTNGNYLVFMEYGFFWSSTPDSPSTAFYRGLYSDFEQVFRDASNRNVGISVRCVKDN